MKTAYNFPDQVLRAGHVFSLVKNTNEGRGVVILMKKYLALGLALFINSSTVAQSETFLFEQEGIKLTYQLWDTNKSKHNNQNTLVKQWAVKATVVNNSGVDVRFTTPFRITWKNYGPLPSGEKAVSNSMLIGRGTLKKNSSVSATAIVYTSDIHQGEFPQKVELKHFKGVWTKLKPDLVPQKPSVLFAQHVKNARQAEARQDYQTALREWQWALAQKPDDKEAAAKVKEMESKMTGQNYTNYVKSNLKDDKIRKAKEESGRKDMFGLMIQGAGILYKGLGIDKKEKNIFSQRGMRFNFSCGYSFSLYPGYSNNKRESYNGRAYTYDYDTEKSSVYTLNLQMGLQFWPYYSKNAGIGLLAETQGGFLPLAGTNASYQYSLGGHAFVGSNKVKLSGQYLMGDRGVSYNYVLSSGGKTIYNSEGAAKFTRLMVGPRFTIKSNEHPNRHLEIFYVKEAYPNMKQIEGNGINITYTADNRIKIYADYMFSSARIGVIQYELDADVKNTGLAIGFGVLRTMDWYSQK